MYVLDINGMCHNSVHNPSRWTSSEYPSTILQNTILCMGFMVPSGYVKIAIENGH